MKYRVKVEVAMPEVWVFYDVEAASESDALDAVRSLDGADHPDEVEGITEIGHTFEGCEFLIYEDPRLANADDKPVIEDRTMRLLEIAKSAQAGNITEEQARALICDAVPGITTAELHALIGTEETAAP